ncbi:MAG: hypothetical protein KAS32_17155 [Candidatus Peribacteraceae bacterium]|nr:hypothetical protein [Candidatus Peribacteraceae bacterium]
MAFTNDWDETTPSDTTQANQIDDFTVKVRKDNRERLAVDHNFSSSDTGQSVGEATIGMHKQVTLYAPISTPTGIADHGFVYTKDVNSKAELHYLDEDDNEIQLTSAGQTVQSVDVDGTPTAVFTKYLTGNLNGTITNLIAHGVASGLTKILSCTIFLQGNGDAFVSMYDFIAAAGTGTGAFVASWTATTVDVSVSGSFANANATYKIKIDYIL